MDRVGQVGGRVGQGLPVADRSTWRAFVEEYHRVHEDLLKEHNAFRESVGVAACPPDEFNTHSPWLKLYLFPEVADYDRRIQSAVSIQTGKMRRQADFLLARALKRAGWK